MSKPLTLRNREDKGDVDLDSLTRFQSFPCNRNIRFPSYFDDFYNFSCFLALSLRATLTKRRFGRKHEITPAAAIMAIV
jgi:hypothetical protein